MWVWFPGNAVYLTHVPSLESHKWMCLLMQWYRHYIWLVTAYPSAVKLATRFLSPVQFLTKHNDNISLSPEPISKCWGCNYHNQRHVMIVRGNMYEYTSMPSVLFSSWKVHRHNSPVLHPVARVPLSPDLHIRVISCEGTFPPQNTIGTIICIEDIVPEIVPSEILRIHVIYIFLQRVVRNFDIP